MVITIKDADFSSVKIGVDEGFTTLQELSNQKGMYIMGGTDIVASRSSGWEILMYDIRGYNIVKVKHSGASGSGGGIFSLLCDADGVPADNDAWLTDNTGIIEFKTSYIKTPRSFNVIDGWTSGVVKDAVEQTIQIDISQGYKYMWVMHHADNTNPLEVIAR